MRKLICIASIFLIGKIYGQVRVVITGKVIEKSTKEPIAFGNVALYKTDSSLVSGVNTNKDGIYLLNNVIPGSYFIQVSYIGFNTTQTKPFSITDTSRQISMEPIFITTSGVLLGQTEVSAERSLYENNIDRKVYNVDKDLMSKTSTASEILNNIPSVSVDIDGNVSLRGMANVMILINGKPSPMMKINSAAALQQISANSIERIEIITNPSAKYKPDGTSGIINIILKKEKRSGTNATLIANAGNNDRYNANLTANYKLKKTNLYGSYAIRQDNKYKLSKDLRTIKDSNVVTNYNRVGEEYALPLSHVGTFGIEYSINNNNEIGLSGNYFREDYHQVQKLMTLITDDTAQVVNDYNRDRNTKKHEYEKGATLSFTHNFKKEGNVLQSESNLADYFEEKNNHFTEIHRYPYFDNTYDNIVIAQKSKQFIQSLEYTYPINDSSEFQAGYLGEFSNNKMDNFAEYYGSSEQAWVKDIQKSNLFIIDQNINALYFTFSGKRKKVSFLGGLRAEQALMQMNLVSSDTTIPNNYFKIYPTLHTAYDIKEGQQIQLNYSKRVNRPDGENLNPFPSYRDPRNIQAGNPKLLPEQIHSFELGYQLKKESFTLLTTVYYRYKYDGFTEISKYINDTTLLITSENLSSDKSEGVECVFTTHYKKILSINLSANGYYQSIDASNLGYAGTKTSFSGNIKMNLNINISNSTVIQLNSNYRSSRLTPQGNYLPSFVLNAGIRQDIFKKKVSLTLTVSDIFNTLNSSSIIDTPDLYQKVTAKRKSQIIYLGFVYPFGKINKKSSEDLKFDNKI